MEELLKEILDDLKTELELTEESDVALLASKIKSAAREVQILRNFPDSFTEEQILNDMKKRYFNIRGLALYDFNQIGVEGQRSHSENGTSRTWKDRNECLNGIFAYCS